MSDSYRPQYRLEDWPPPPPPPALESMFRFRGNPDPPTAPRGFRAETRARPNPRGGRFGGISQRPLLRLRQDTDARSLLLPNSKSKFRDIDELTDSDEDYMSDSDEELPHLRPAKRLRTDAMESPSSAATPKWSNPDPYTALPPPTEATGKRLDVVKLIRKAKISEDSTREELDLAKNEDFISFDDDLDEFPDAPRGPRADQPDQLGKRKRGQEDARPRPPGGYPSAHGDAPVLRDWQAANHVSPTPWLSPSSSGDSAATALHKEIIDFYEWVRPKEYEQEVRADLLKRLSLAFNQIDQGELKAFGSYAAGLYLPTSDMDLVFLQRTFRPGLSQASGLPPPPKRSLLERFAKRLRDTGIARAGSVQLIPWAKVPIIKFVDHVTGLRIDLSFNNDSGVIANETFQKWKSQYPAMPIIVSIIKQFLMIRGLNDVSVGGLGGFSVICLVTSLIQHFPGVGTPLNLGQVLVEFFNLYGNLVDKDTVAIRLDPPGYIDKVTYKPHLFSKEKAGRLTIIDPNRPENNISGGTREIGIILSCFSSAYTTLQERLSAFTYVQADGSEFSFMKDLVGGNFASYENQRTVSKTLYFGLTGKEAAELPTRSSTTMTSHSDSRPAQVPSKRTENGIKPALTGAKPRTKAKGSTVQDKKPTVATLPVPAKKITKAERRAIRLKAARPDLEDLVGSKISAPDAIRIGRYNDAAAMAADLENKLNPSKKNKKKPLKE